MSNNFSDIFYKEKKNGEQSLWRAVILQAFVDLKNNSKKKIANTYRIKATLWFNKKNQNFIKACHFANFDPEYVLEKAEIIKNLNYNKYCKKIIYN